MGGWNYKGVSTNNRKRVLPSSGSLRLARGGGEGPGEGVQTVQAFVLGQAWPVGMQPRGRWRQGMADPSALARGRIQTLKGESLLLQAPWSPGAPGSFGGSQQSSPCF